MALSKLFGTSSKEDQQKPLRFSWQEIASALVVAQGIHEGHWQVGANLRSEAMVLCVDADTGVYRPASTTIFDHFILFRVPGPGPLSVDAAEVNPARTH